MPTYQYYCDNCNHEFDKFQSIHDNSLRKCPKCSKNKLRRIFGTGIIVLFKGSGWTDPTSIKQDSFRRDI